MICTLRNKPPVTSEALPFWASQTGGLFFQLLNQLKMVFRISGKEDLNKKMARVTCRFHSTKTNIIGTDNFAADLPNALYAVMILIMNLQNPRNGRPIEE